MSVWILSSSGFAFRDFVQFGILSNSGFCLTRDFVHLGFRAIWDFVRSGVCPIRDFVQDSFILGAQKYNQNKLATLLNFSNLT